MKICFVAPANNYHTKKWCKWFSNNGHEVHVVSFINDIIENTEVHYIDAGVSFDSNDSRKLKYLFKSFTVKKIIKKIEPDIINVHYASSYGAVMALTGIKGYILSLWGSDVFEFPRKSFFHKMLIKYSLSKCKYLFSTSKYMALEAKKYTKKNIVITPFGVDMDVFNEKNRHRDTDSLFIIGTVKKLEPLYGIDILLNAVSIVCNERPDINLSVRIAGNGSHEEIYHKLAEDLRIASKVNWLGFISEKEAAIEWANMDLAVIPSRSESFGVSAIEAQACGIPVIISDIDGLKEATSPGETSIVLKDNTDTELAKAIILANDSIDLYREIGKKGIKYVNENFELNTCFRIIENEYIKILHENGNSNNMHNKF